MLVKEQDVEEILGPDSDDRVRYKKLLTGLKEVKGFNLIIGNIKPGGGTRSHVHDNRGEVYYIIRGKAKFQIGNEDFEADDGTAIYVPPATEHAMKNHGNTDLKLILFQISSL